MFDGRALGEAIVSQVREFVGRSMLTLSGRVDALEKRAPVPGPQGERGERGDKGDAGKDADPMFIRSMVDEAVAAIPKPSAGKDGVDGTPGQDGKDGINGKDGMNGKDVDMSDVDRQVQSFLSDCADEFVRGFDVS